MKRMPGMLDEPDQVPRLHQFRQEHPNVIIGSGGFGTWQARIPETDGETVITRYTLRELLDKLHELTIQRCGWPTGAPDGPVSQSQSLG
jgi:hypothetical protein